jgi:excisionase family DNA binding protein
MLRMIVTKGSPFRSEGGSMENEYCSATEAARLLKVSRMLISRRIQSGKLPAFEDPRDGRKKLVRASDIKALEEIRPAPAKEAQTASAA